MNMRDHYELFRYLMEHYCLLSEDIIFVENVSDWCREQGINEPDRKRPLKLISKEGAGCRLVISEQADDKAIADRIKAMDIRGKLRNVAMDEAEMLNTDRKKLAYLFLSEYAGSLPEIGSDELLADNWAVKEMERLGFIKV